MRERPDPAHAASAFPRTNRAARRLRLGVERRLPHGGERKEVPSGGTLDSLTYHGDGSLPLQSILKVAS